jgi:hypothetical protein
MEQLKRRDALKVASAAALVTALGAVATAKAETPPAKKSRVVPTKKSQKLFSSLTIYQGRVASVTAGASEFAFGLLRDDTSQLIGLGIKDPAGADALAVRVVLMAYERGMDLTVLVDPSAPDYAFFVSA